MVMEHYEGPDEFLRNLRDAAMLSPAKARCGFMRQRNGSGSATANAPTILLRLRAVPDNNTMRTAGGEHHAPRRLRHIY